MSEERTPPEVQAWLREQLFNFRFWSKAGLGGRGFWDNSGDEKRRLEIIRDWLAKQVDKGNLV